MENFNLDDYEFKTLRRGDIIDAEVVSVIDDITIALDVKSNTEGIMHLDHYTNDKAITTFKGLVKKGDIIKCEVTKVSEDSILLSRLNQIKEEAFNELVKAFEEGQIVTLTVKSLVEGKGYNCICGSNSVFMPLSQAGQAVNVGDKIEAKLIEVNSERKRAVASKRVVEQEAYQAKKLEEYDSINVGDVVTGTIAKIEAYGAIIKLGNVQGLLRANQIAYEFVKINEVLKLNDKIEVKVINKADGKLEFSRKALLKSPFELYVENNKVGSTVTGKVAEKLAFGLLIEVAPNVKALLHKSEYSHNPNDNFNNCVVIGDEVEAAILAIDQKKEKISLSRKALIDNPWSRVTAKTGDLVDCKITEIKENGLLVSTLGVDGFVPQSEAIVEAKKDLASYYAVGDDVKAYIIDINTKEWKLKLSITKYLREEERKNYEKYLNENEEISTSLADLLK